MQQERAPSFRTRLLCWHYLPSWAGQVLFLRLTRCLWHLAARKSPVLSDEALMLALPIFPGSHPPSIVGVHELNFCVRDGNRWTLMTINTNFCGWLLTISMSNAFASNALHSSTSSRACQALFQGLGDPYRIRTDVKGVRGLCLNHLTNGPWCTFTDSNRGPTD